MKVGKSCLHCCTRTVVKDTSIQVPYGTLLNFCLRYFFVVLFFEEGLSQRVTIKFYSKDKKSICKNQKGKILFNMASCLQKFHSSSAYRLFVLWMLYYPLACVIFSLFWAWPIALADKTAYLNAFFFEMSLFTGSIIPLTDWAPPTDGTGSFAIVNLLAVAHQVILACFIGVSAGPMIEGLLDIKGGMLMKKIDPEGTLLIPRTKSGLFLKMIVFYIIIVVLSIIWAAYWGGFMSLAEGWPFLDGFVTALGVITSGLTVLQPDKFPVTGWGLFCGFYTGVMGAAMLGLTIAVASVPLLGVDLAYDDSPAVRIFPMLLLSAEQREKLGLKGGCCGAKGGDSKEESADNGGVEEAA